MTFSEPVESLDTISGELREAEPQLPKQHKELAIRAADHIDDLQHKAGNDALALNMMRGLMKKWADKLEASTNVKIGMMDSDSRASEKMREAQMAVIEVAQSMREVAK